MTIQILFLSQNYGFLVKNQLQLYNCYIGIHLKLIKLFCENNSEYSKKKWIWWLVIYEECDECMSLIPTQPTRSSYT